LSSLIIDGLAIISLLFFPFLFLSKKVHGGTSSLFFPSPLLLARPWIRRRRLERERRGRRRSFFLFPLRKVVGKYELPSPPSTSIAPSEQGGIASDIFSPFFFSLLLPSRSGRNPLSFSSPRDSARPFPSFSLSSFGMQGYVSSLSFLPSVETEFQDFPSFFFLIIPVFSRHQCRRTLFFLFFFSYFSWTKISFPLFFLFLRPPYNIG